MVLIQVASFVAYFVIWLLKSTLTWFFFYTYVTGFEIYSHIGCFTTNIETFR